MRRIITALANRPILVSTATVAISFVALFLIEDISAAAARRELGEAGFVENVSALLWFVAAAVGVVAATRHRDVRPDLLLIAWIWVIFGARELDFHTRFTPWNMAHAIKYTRDEIPLPLRLGVILFVAVPLVTAVILIMTRWRRGFLAAVRARKPWPRGVVWWMVLLGGSRVADKVTGIWKGPAAQHDAWLFRAAEESIELGLVVLTVLLLARLALTPPARERAG